MNLEILWKMNKKAGEMNRDLIGMPAGNEDELRLKAAFAHRIKGFCDAIAFVREISDRLMDDMARDYGQTKDVVAEDANVEEE